MLRTKPEIAFVKDHCICWSELRGVLTGLEEERKKHKEALMAAVDAAFQHGMAPGCVEPLRALVLERYPGAVLRALYDDSPARV